MIPVCEPSITEAEVANAAEAVRSGWISSQGAYLKDFEAAFAELHGVKHAIAMSSGTAALEVGLHSIGVQPGDEVIVPAFTIISVALAVIRVGAIPRFVDVQEHTWNIEPDAVRRSINGKTRAVIVVHSFGHPAQMDVLKELANAHDLKIIEDTAEAICSRFNGKLCGTFGDVGTFSLYGNKLVTTGEGGVVITDDDETAHRARRYINLYFGEEERFSHSELGYNFRMTNVQAAIGVAQLKRIEQLRDRKLRIGKWYSESLRSSRVATFQRTVGDVDHVYWMYCVLLKECVPVSASEAISRLRDKGIGTRPFFKGLHLQSPLKKYVRPSDGPFVVTEALYRHGLYLPSATTLTRAQVTLVANALEALV